MHFLRGQLGGRHGLSSPAIPDQELDLGGAEETIFATADRVGVCRVLARHSSAPMGDQPIRRPVENILNGGILAFVRHLGGHPSW